MYVVAAVPRVLPRIEGVYRHLAERCQIFMFTGKDNNSTYDHRSVRTGHPVRNHEVSIVFVVPGTRNLEKKVLIAGIWNARDS